MAVVRSNLGWSSAAGLLPVPGLDLAAIVGVQVNMLREIAAVYGKPFPASGVPALVVALLSGGSYVVAGPTSSLLKAVPVIGTIAGMITLPALAAAACYATGKVFIQHFESGGTFLDFEPARVRAYYAQQFDVAKAETAR